MVTINVPPAPLINGSKNIDDANAVVKSLLDTGHIRKAFGGEIDGKIRGWLGNLALKV